MRSCGFLPDLDMRTLSQCQPGENYEELPSSQRTVPANRRTIQPPRFGCLPALQTTKDHRADVPCQNAPPLHRALVTSGIPPGAFGPDVVPQACDCLGGVQRHIRGMLTISESDGVGDLNKSACRPELQREVCIFTIDGLLCKASTGNQRLATRHERRNPPPAPLIS